jgi:hypothetical protein
MTLSIQYNPYKSNTEYQSNLCIYGMLITVNLPVGGETSFQAKFLTTVVYFVFSDTISYCSIDIKQQWSNQPIIFPDQIIPI